MPRQLLLSRIPVDLSVIEFDLDKEELFLSYTWNRHYGPGITRDGVGPPKMESPEATEAPTPVTNATALRMGTWLLRQEFLEREIEDARAELTKLRDNPDLAKEAHVVERTIEELERWRGETGVIHAHDVAFAARYPGYEIVAQQGCGDLTMNAWCVAYVNNALAESKPELVRLHSEPVEYRTYSCLVKWKPSPAGVQRMTIEDVTFSQSPEAAVKGLNRKQWLPRGSSIDFAVSNQQVIRDGAIVPVVTTCRQFGDLRHLLQLPNVNPKERISPDDREGPDGTFRPRRYKGVRAGNDIWLAEEQLLPQPKEPENLLRTALNGPVILDFPPDHDKTSIRGALALADYTEVFSDLEPLRPGEWRFVRRDTAEFFLEIFIRRNTYSWTMVGLTADGRKLLWLACTGYPARLVGYTIEEAARIFLDAGAWNALLVDEGFDAMQEVRWNDSTQFEAMIPRKRGRIRAAFIVGKRRSD